MTIGPDTEVDRDFPELPKSFELFQNYPNPFNPSTSISFTLPEEKWVTLKVYNIQGISICTLESGIKDPGLHSVTWDGSDTRGNKVPSGIYLCRMKAGDYRQTIRMLYLQ